jgi:tetratricopeptide (TPR) repeat protein
MQRRYVVMAVLAVALAGRLALHGVAQEEKVHTVGKEGLILEGKVEKASRKVKFIFTDTKAGEFPAQLFVVKLAAGKQYRITMDSKVIDSFLVVQNEAGQQVAWDDDSGGESNALLTLDVLKDSLYKVYAACISPNGAGPFTLKVQEVSAVTVHGVGAGFKVQGELRRIRTLAYNVKLEADKTYIIDLYGLQPKGVYPFLLLLDAAGTQLAKDAGDGSTAQIIYRPKSAAVYQLVATNFGKGQGPFTLTVGPSPKGDHTPEKMQELLREARQLNAQAGQLLKQGSFNQAEPLLVKAAALRKEVLGEKHPAYATTLNNLGALYKQRRDYDRAEPLYLQALAIRKAVLGEKHPDYARTLNNLATLHQARGDYAKAEPLCLEALAIRKEVRGEKDAEYISSLHNLAALYQDRGDHRKAESLYVQILAIEEQVLGERSPTYALTLQNLAELYRKRGDHGKAEPLYRQALAIIKEKRGEKHPYYAIVLSNLATLFQDRGDYARAEPLLLQALAVRKEAFTAKHPEYASGLHLLAMLHQNRGDHRKAELLYLEALAITKEVLGEKDPAYTASLQNLAVLYRERGDRAKAEPLLVQALAITKEMYGQKHPDYAASLHNLALLYQARGDHGKAEALLLEALAITKEVPGANHPRYAACLSDLALLYRERGDHRKAEPLLEQALAIRKEVLGEKHPVYANSLNNLAVVYRERGDHAKAEPLLLQALAITKEVEGEKHPAYATSLNNLALLHEDRGNHSKAEPLLLDALAILKEVEGEKHPDYATSLHNLASLYLRRGDHGKAEPLFLQAVAITKEVCGEKHPAYATNLQSLAALYRERGDHGRAEPLLLQALAIQKEVLGEKHPAFATGLGNLAALYRARGDHGKAEPVLLQALAIHKEVVGEKHPEYASSLNNLAALYQERGDHGKAEPLHLQALAIHKEVQGEKHPGFATCLDNLAALHQARGDYAKAEPLCLEALAIRKEVLGAKHPMHAFSLNSLAVLYQARGDHARAEPLYLQALAIQKEVLGEKHPDYINSLDNLATLYRDRGDLARTEPLFLQILAIRKEILGEKHPAYALSLDHLAVLYEDHGDLAQAEPLRLKALTIQKEVLGEKHPAYAATLDHLGTLYRDRGDYGRAEPPLLQALAIRKEVLGEKHPDHARSLITLALLYHDRGDYAKAEPPLLQALAIYKEVLGEKHPHYAHSLHSLAVLHHNRGEHGKAEPLYLQALDALQVGPKPLPWDRLQADNLRAVALTVRTLDSFAHHWMVRGGKVPTNADLRAAERSLTLALEVLERIREQEIGHEHSKVGLTENHFDLFSRKIHISQLLFQRKQKAENLAAVFRTAEQGTARAFVESLAKTRVNLLAGVNPKLQAQELKLLDNLRGLDLSIDKASALPLTQRDAKLVGQLMTQRDDVEAQLKQLIAQMEQEHPQFAAFKYPRPCSLEDARKCLADDEIALLFVPGTETSFLVLVEARPKPDDKTNGIAVFDLPGWDTLTEQVATLTDPKTLEKPARVKALARETFDALLGPCQERLKGKHLVIVPGGPLCFLPFGMLVGPDGKYVIEKHRIRYAPSLTALHFIRLWKDKRQQPEVPLFAVGDPVYEEAAPPPNPKGPRGDLLSVSFVPPQRGDRPPGGVAETPPAGAEARRDLLWREGKAPSFPRLVHSGKEVDAIADLLKAKPEFVLKGTRATEANVKAASAKGLMGKARYVHFATHGILGLDQGKQPALVLSLVGNTDEDGFLQMDEITSLKLNADLVVLSACRTGQGRMHRGEGVTGLARAFLYAGSKGVVCSLWNVADKETADLMVDFYSRLQKEKGVSATEALCEAQRAMIRAGKAPVYWAPFILIGE